MLGKGFTIFQGWVPFGSMHLDDCAAQSLAQNTFAGLFDVLMQGIRCQIQFAGPGHEVFFDAEAIEKVGIPQPLEYTAIGTGREPHNALKAIRESYMEAAMLQNASFQDIPIHHGLTYSNGAMVAGGSFR